MQKPKKKETIRTANACNSIWLSKHSDKIGRLFVCKDKQTDSELFIRGEQKKRRSLHTYENANQKTKEKRVEINDGITDKMFSEDKKQNSVIFKRKAS